MKNTLLLKISFLMAVTINIVCPPPTIEQKRAQLHALIDWNHVDSPVPLNSLSFRYIDTRQSFNMTPLCHAIALDDRPLVRQLIKAGANIDGGDINDNNNYAFVDGRVVNLKPILIARNHLPALKYLLNLGAKTLTVEEIKRYGRTLENRLWFEREAYEMLLSYKINDEFNMRDPRVRDVIQNRMFGQFLRQLHDQCKFGCILSDEEKALVQSKRQVFYDFLYDQSGSQPGREKVKILFNPTHFDENILVSLSILESKNPNFGKNGEVSIRSRFGLE